MTKHLTPHDYQGASVSWWLCPPDEPRQAFYERAASELSRMRNTKFGTLMVPNYADHAMAQPRPFARRDNAA